MSQIHVTKIRSPQIIISGNNFNFTVDQPTIRGTLRECDQADLEEYNDSLKILRTGQNIEFGLETPDHTDTKVFVMNNGLFTIRSLDCMFNSEITMEYQSNQRVIAEFCDFITSIIREQLISLKQKQEQNKKQKL